MSRRFRVIWTEVAIADVEGNLDYVAVHDSLAAAEKLYDKLETSIHSLVTSPRGGRVEVGHSLDRIVNVGVGANGLLEVRFYPRGSNLGP